MSANEKTSARVAAIASKAMQNPKSLTPEEIQALAASALNQSPDQQGQSGQQNRQDRQQGQQNPQGQQGQPGQQRR